MFLFCWYKYWILNRLVWLATKFWWSNRSDTILMTGISRSPSPAISYFQTERNNVINNMVKNLFLNSTIRTLEICLYKTKGVFYWPNYCNVFNSILPSTVTSINFELVNICHVLRSLSSCEFCLMKQLTFLQTKLQQHKIWANVMFSEEIGLIGKKNENKQRNPTTVNATTTTTKKTRKLW